MATRTFGWIQNPSDFKKLKLTVQVFDKNSKHYDQLKTRLVPDLIPNKSVKSTLLKLLSANETTFKYKDLVGSSSTALGTPSPSRRQAVADSLLQVTILPQNARTSGKKWTDDWTADGFLRWAVTLGFVEHNREFDTFTITESGKLFSQSKVKPEEDPILLTAMLQYPPAYRVLSLIEKHSENGGANKFQIGNELGFKGEIGFTSYSADLMEYELINAPTNKEKTKIRQDTEGTSDKYARMIATWLGKLSLTRSLKTTLQTPNGPIHGFPRYVITLKGKQALNNVRGKSSHKKRPKRINWEYLATAVPNRDYHRTRRAIILEALQTSTSIESLLHQCLDKGFETNKAELKMDLRNLTNIGIDIDISDKTAQLRDDIIGLNIPPSTVTKKLEDEQYENLKTELIRETDLPDDCYELLDLAYDGRSNRALEIQTAALFEEHLNFNVVLMGGGKRPDIVATSDSGFSLIIDTKAYRKGYGKSISQEDAMVRYIEDCKFNDPQRNDTKWWEAINQTISRDRVYFLWVSSFFLPTFAAQINSTSRRTGFNGSALSIDHLLRATDTYRKGGIQHADLELTFSSNEVNSDAHYKWLESNNS